MTATPDSVEVVQESDAVEPSQEIQEHQIEGAERDRILRLIRAISPIPERVTPGE
jgi:hypothetical protein